MLMSVVGGPSADGTAPQSVGRSRVRIAALVLVGQTVDGARDLKDFRSIRINDQWRLIFKWL
jgi:hypothetical protein